MPTVRYRTRSRKESPSSGVRAYLESGEPNEETPLWDTRFVVQLVRLWKELQGDIMLSWVESRPGTRPFGWWEFTAPRAVPRKWKNTRVASRMIVPRKQISGSGVEAWRRLAVAPQYTRGIPALAECDPESPPQFESEARYLKRLHLMSRDETRRVPKRAYEPETLDVDEPAGDDHLNATYALSVSELAHAS